MNTAAEHRGLSGNSLSCIGPISLFVLFRGIDEMLLFMAVECNLI